MTPDGPTPGELDPEQEESVRRLLAAAAEPEPLPRDVADRLDDALADLVAERAEGTQAEPLGRRRRRWPAVLVAAAAVAALAGGVGNMLVSGGPNSAVTSSEHGAAVQSPPPCPSPTPQGPGVPELAKCSFKEGAQLLADDLLGRPSIDGRKNFSVPAPRDCKLPALEPGDQHMAVRLDGDKATLVFRKPVAQTSWAQAYSCDNPPKLLHEERVHAP